MTGEVPSAPINTGKEATPGDEWFDSTCASQFFSNAKQKKMNSDPDVENFCSANDDYVPKYFVARLEEMVEELTNDFVEYLKRNEIIEMDILDSKHFDQEFKLTQMKIEFFKRNLFDTYFSKQ